MDAKVDLLPEQGSAVVSDARSVFEHQLVETLYRDSSASRSHSYHQYQNAKHSIAGSPSHPPLDERRNYHEDGLMAITATYVDLSPMRRQQTKLICQSIVDQAQMIEDFEWPVKRLQENMAKLKRSTQEFQIDITRRKMRVPPRKINEMIVQSASLNGDIERQMARSTEVLATQEKLWQKRLNDIEEERRRFNALIGSLNDSRTQYDQVIGIAMQVETFAETFGALSPHTDQKDLISAIFQQIQEINPNSDRRLDSIRTATQTRDRRLQSQVNVLDRALQEGKTKLRGSSVVT